MIYDLLLLNCSAISDITFQLPITVIPTENLKIPHEFVLANPNFNFTSNVGSLIAANHFGTCYHINLQNLLQETTFGLVINGT